MKRYTELLYWNQFKQFIHFNEDEKGFYYSYDSEISVRTKKSFENWLRENSSRREFRNLMRYQYSGGEPPATSFEEALEMAKEIKPNIDKCLEFEIAYVFYFHEDNIKYDSVTILKETGNVVYLPDYVQKGLKKGNHIALYEI